MSSIFRQQASRANGAKSRGPITEEGKRISAANSVHSTGPITPEGKARVSMNALDHGLLAKSVILPEENEDGFLHHLASLTAIYQPEDYEEHFIVEKMAFADWLHLRNWCCEMALVARATRQQAMASDDLTNEMHLDIPAMHTAIGMKNLADTGPFLNQVRRYGIAASRESRRVRQQLDEYREKKRLAARRAELRKNKISKQSEPNLGETLTPVEPSTHP